ncbi:unnamed protein product [Dovyalis caffra]|uniref:Uncharacterized protein n=1 Tax=Dovyalis caffra TaxID=77055 RepID=A0AAV1QPW4_9ROSI|nr:unnamed protein product [Dovyalis caffra]
MARGKGFRQSASNVAEASSSGSGKAIATTTDSETPITVVANPGRDRERFLRKLEPPVYNGEEPRAWIFRAERYFSINRLTKAREIESSLECVLKERHKLG